MESEADGEKEKEGRSLARSLSYFGGDRHPPPSLSRPAAARPEPEVRTEDARAVFCCGICRLPSLENCNSD